MMVFFRIGGGLSVLSGSSGLEPDGIFEEPGAALSGGVEAGEKHLYAVEGAVGFGHPGAESEGCLGVDGTHVITDEGGGLLIDFFIADLCCGFYEWAKDDAAFLIGAVPPCVQMGVGCHKGDVVRADLCPESVEVWRSLGLGAVS